MCEHLREEVNRLETEHNNFLQTERVNTILLIKIST
jgi:hypothetical protein